MGRDANPKNDPTYPIKKRTDDEHKGYSWKRPPQQNINAEILHSIERPNVTAVFGNTLPPKGLSGLIRRWAFKSSENSYAHWLPLLLADRVDVAEGLIDDLLHGKIPNIFTEKGYNAEWKHNRTNFIIKMAAVAAVTAGVVAMATGKFNKKPSNKRFGWRKKW